MGEKNDERMGFNPRMSAFLCRISARHIQEPGLEEIYHLRYRAYLREGAITVNPHRQFVDAYDRSENVWTLGIFIDGLLASSIRLHVGSSESPAMPALQVFGEALHPELQRGRTIIDPTRFVTDIHMSRLYPELPYATVRLAWMACSWFGADLLLATVRVEHQAFYRRLFGHKVLVDAVPYPGLKKPISLMAVECKEARSRVHARYPFLDSTASERAALFGQRARGLEDSWPKPRACAANS